MALPAVNSPSFQGAEAIVDPCNVNSSRVSGSHAARPSTPTTSPKSERIFMPGCGVSTRENKTQGGIWLAHHPRWMQMTYASSLIHQHALLAICVTALLCVLRLEASDVPASCPSNGAGHTSRSASSTRPPASGTEAKTKKSGKYDVDCIGQRSIEDGVNLYSLEKERSIGQAMAAAIDLHTKFVDDPDINDYVNRLGQKIAQLRRSGSVHY